MLIGRYNYIRSRLLDLYELVQHRTYAVWIQPTMFMDLDELRDRPTYHREDHVGDTHYYETPQARSMTVAQLTEIMPNMTKETDIGWRSPNTVIPLLYEGIQEYIMLWCEIILQVPEVPYPSLDELKTLENFAFLLFKPYQQIRPYLDLLEQNNNNGINRDLAKSGLASLMGLFKQESIGFKRTADGISFVSYIDQLKTSASWGGQPASLPVSTSDSLMSSQPEATSGLGSWFMMK